MLQSGRKEIRVSGLSEPVSHYTDVVIANGFAFVSGMVALDERGAVVGGDDPVAQTRQALANLGRCLEAVGASPKDVCKVTVYLTDIDERQKVNVARQEFFGSARPASTLVEVAALIMPQLKVEIEAIALLPQG